MEPWHEEKAERRGWFSRLHLSWPMLLVAGWLLYELTAQPGLGALVACAKFGWADVRTALWLRRVDPDRRRGQTCFWAYLTYGLWKVGFMATAALITIGLLDNYIAPILHLPARKGPPPVLSGMLTAIAMSFSISLPVAHIALWLAWRNGVRVWLGNAPTRARKERFWPPRQGRVNMAIFVASTTILLTMSVLLFIGVGLIALIRPNETAAKIMSQVMSAAIFFGTIAFFRRALPRCYAASPEECWPIEEGEEGFQAQLLEESTN